ncbi:MAG: hypothetical protein ACM3S4_03850 [Burkholderiales bacterium]
MKRMHKSYDKIGPAREKQIARHEQTESEKDIGLPEDVRVTHSGESNPHDG